jgi:serine/threonine-protein kinase
MSTEVVLKVIRGKLRGKCYRFPGPALCLVGRADDCQIRLPDDAEHRPVSRHHCLLEVDPPCVWVRDFGSRNGTYVNDARVGQGAGEEPAEGDLPQCALGPGDRLRVGRTVFRVYVLRKLACAACGATVSSSARPGGAAPLCPACEEKAPAVVAPAPVSRSCGICGREVGESAAGETGTPEVCAACRADPRRAAETLIAQADSGREGFGGIRGYRLVRELGRHPNCAVYLARHERTLELIALKVMFPRGAGEARTRLRFVREAQNMMVLRHPNVVQLCDAGWSEGAFYFTMEYCEGGTAAQLQKEHGGLLGLDVAGPLVMQALDGLEFVHTKEIPFVAHEGGEWSPGRGLVHRDVKPSNLFLTGRPQRRLVKLGDFGLAKAYGKSGVSGLTGIGMLSGTPFFMPRQQVLGYKFAQPEVDVWAMAATLYFLLTGKPARDFTSRNGWMEVILETPAVPIRQHRPDLPDRVAGLIDHALTERPEIPFKTAAAFQKELEAVL